MPPRQVACDPCRFSKLACDHSKPICSRCQERDQASHCVYRARPFKRKRVSTPQDGIAPPEAEISLTTPPANSRKYPNAGYLGSSSHEVIFDRLSMENQIGTEEHVSDTMDVLQDMPETLVDDAQVRHGANVLERIASLMRIPLCQRIVQSWTSRGVNLALAGDFTEDCALTINEMFASLAAGEQESHIAVSRRLFASSCKPIKMSEDSTIAEFRASFTGLNARWETLSLFLTAVGRATMDFNSFETLYNGDNGRRRIRKLAMQFADSCLEIALSLDCLNDLQLILQYENFIFRSTIDGDQSYHSWRRLGDVISSLLALGYHERTETGPGTPTFLRDLRRAALSRAYSGDKNVSIFLGRPPRLLRKYCNLRLPCGDIDDRYGKDTSASHLRVFQNWPRAEEFSYLMDTCWSAALAVLKEDILDLSREENEDERGRKAQITKVEAEAHWAALPSNFRLQGSLRLSKRKPIECDFMVSARLNYLHVLFLLRLALVRQTPEADSELLTVSASMLNLVVEAILLKDRLANSGTSLMWKVAYYGLRAAGIICLSLLHQVFTASSTGVPIAEVFQNLNVLVAEVETGTFAHFEHPNYELLAHAARTIKNVLSRVLSGDLSRARAEDEPMQQTLQSNPEEWIPWTDQDPWEFEIDFWRNLAYHPTLAGMDPYPSDLF